MERVIAQSRSEVTQLWERDGKYFQSYLLKSGREEVTELSPEGARQLYQNLTVKVNPVAEWETAPKGFRTGA